MSPHGSKLTEAMRYIANRFLTDQQRKKIKTTLAKLQRIPLQIFGIESLVNSQREEIERLKSRLTILDGKFSLALYGMPHVEEKFRSLSPTNSFFNQFSNSVTNRELKSLGSVSKYEFRSSLLLASEILKQSQPKKCLLTGLDSLQFCRDLMSHYLGIETVLFNDTDPQQIMSLKASLDLKIPSEKFEFEYALTDPLTALIAMGEKSLDFILCIDRFQRLVPLEQIKYLHLSCEKLSVGGVLFLLLPDLSQKEISQDLYWADPYHLRFYSLSLIQSIMALYPGKVEVLKTPGFEVGVLFQKAMN